MVLALHFWLSNTDLEKGFNHLDLIALHNNSNLLHNMFLNNGKTINIPLFSSVSVCCTQSGIGKYTVLHRATVFWIQWSYHGKALPYWVANVQECHVFVSTVFFMHEITLLYFYSVHEFLQTNLSSGTLICRSFYVKISILDFVENPGINVLFYWNPRHFDTFECIWTFQCTPKLIVSNINNLVKALWQL